jgi:hypothetical protein
LHILIFWGMNQIAGWFDFVSKLNVSSLEILENFKRQQFNAILKKNNYISGRVDAPPWERRGNKDMALSETARLGYS